jgi:hypothetical protein
MPLVVAELGPGSSIGVGIAALLAGARRYYALDLVDFTNPKLDVVVFDQLASFFRCRAPIPASGAHSCRFPDLDNYEWPDWLDLGPSRQWEERVAAIREDVVARSERFVKIVAPWMDRAIMEEGSVDWIVSQSVLEHVDALYDAYEAMARWLTPRGHASHLIDFSSHRMTKEWNGHWAIDDLTWHIMRGKRPYLLNRYAYTDHLTIAAKCGLAPVAELRNKRFDGLIRNNFVARFREISDEDARANMVFVILRKDG